MSGDPTRAEVDAMFQNTVDILETSRSNGAAQVADLNALEQSLEGDYVSTQAAWAQGTRNLIAAPSSGGEAGNARSALLPIARLYGKLADSPYTNSGNLRALLRDVYLYWNSQDIKVTSRALSFGTPTASGSNTGDGSLDRCTVDGYGNTLEMVIPETLTWECSQDQSSGAKRHAEVFRVTGEAPGLDGLELNGSGLSGSVVSRSARTDRSTGSLLRNSSFQTYSSAGSVTTMFPGWTLDQTTGVSQDTTNYFRGVPGLSGGSSIQLGAARRVSQKISVNNATGLDRNQPYALRVMVNRAVGSFTGTVTINLGSQTKALALAAQSGWNEILLDIGTGSWFENFNEDELDVGVEVTTYTGGTVLVGDVILTPMTFVGGTYWFLRGGATPWLAANSSLPEGDIITVATTGGAPGTGLLQYWWWLAFGTFLPITGSTTIADPS